MNNYKIRVNNEAESNEARNLFCELGFTPDSSRYRKYVAWVAVFEDGSGSFYSNETNLNECQELTLPQLRDLVAQSKLKDQGLISGAEALANVHKHIVQYLHDDEPYGRWTTITDHLWSQYHLGMFLDPKTKFKFRLKPQTIKVELELPMPFEPKQDETYWYLTTSNSKGYDWNQFQSVMGDEFYCQFGVWRTEEEVKQVVDQLRKLRGKK